MRSADYWADAALKREMAVQEGATAAAEDVLKLYDAALDDINAEMKRILFNFRVRYGIDEKTAAYFLDEAQRSENLKRTIYALEHAPNKKQRQAILDFINRDGLSVRAYAARSERFDAVKQSIFARMKKLAADNTEIVAAALKKAYGQSYYGLMDDTAQGLNVGIDFGILNDRAVEEAVSVPWHDKRFSERIWDNTDRLARTAQEITTRYIMSGRSLDKAARELREEFDVEKFHATTLIRTEVAHAHARADKAAYEDLGIEEYRYLATLDERTCETCQPLDNRVFRVKDIREGVNYPVMHPRCRCTTTINTDWVRRRARDPETGRTYLIDGDMTYEEWIASLSPEQKQALDTAKLKNSRKTADKAQYGKYKAVLGKENVPKTFDKWQDMKYNKTDENVKRYEELKYYYKGLNNGYVTKNASGGFVIIRKTTKLQDRPNSITQVTNKKGGIDRNYYGTDGWQFKQISNNGHGHKKEEAMGKHGEHAHDYPMVDGIPKHGEARGLTNAERKENADIL